MHGRSRGRASLATGETPVVPVSRQDGGALSQRRSRGDRPTGHAGRVTLPGGCSPYTGIAFSLHGESRLPTRRVWVSYTAKRRFLHGTSHIRISEVARDRPEG